MMKKVSARGIVINNNKVLLLRRNNHGEKYYSIPGGGVENNENLQDTVKREIEEETSILANPTEIIGTFESKNTIQNIYLCEYISGEPKLGNSVEKAKMEKDPKNTYEPVWLDISEAVNVKIQPEVAEEAFKGCIIEIYNNNISAKS